MILVGGKFGAVRIVIPFAAEDQARITGSLNHHLRIGKGCSDGNLITARRILRIRPEESAVGVQRDPCGGDRVSVERDVALRQIAPRINRRPFILVVQIPVVFKNGVFVIRDDTRKSNRIAGVEFDGIYALAVFRESAALNNEGNRIGQTPAGIQVHQLDVFGAVRIDHAVVQLRDRAAGARRIGIPAVEAPAGIAVLRRRASGDIAAGGVDIILGIRGIVEEVSALGVEVDLIGLGHLSVQRKCALRLEIVRIDTHGASRIRIPAEDLKRQVNVVHERELRQKLRVELLAFGDVKRPRALILGAGKIASADVERDLPAFGPLGVYGLVLGDRDAPGRLGECPVKIPARESQALYGSCDL